MANKAHLAILKRGVEVWNQWRKDNPEVSPDLSGANLIEADLRGVDLHGADLRRAKLYGAKLYEADLREADLCEADLREAKLYAGYFHHADLSGADLCRANLRGADLREADLFGANLREAILPWTNDGVGFSENAEPEPSWSLWWSETVSLGASAPHTVKLGEEFTARFVAYLKAFETRVNHLVSGLSPSTVPHLGLDRCHWKEGTRVTVIFASQSLQVDEPKQEFEWSAPYKLVNFDVTVPQDAPEETVVLKFDVHVEGFRIAKLRLDLHISRR